MSDETQSPSLAALLDARLLALPGVTALFRSGNVVTNAIATAAEALSPAAGGHERVAVDIDDTGAAEVVVSLGVRIEQPIGATLEAAQRAIESEVESFGSRVGAVRITVVHTRG